MCREFTKPGPLTRCVRSVSRVYKARSPNKVCKKCVESLRKSMNGLSITTVTAELNWEFGKENTVIKFWNSFNDEMQLINA